MGHMTSTRRRTQPLAGRSLALLVLAVLAGLIAMHGLGPTGAAVPAQAVPVAVTADSHHQGRTAAERTGIGRATLYKYFPDVEAIPAAHHERHVTGHLARLARLAELRDQPGGAGERLEAVLEQYALICYHRRRHGTEELATLLHRGEHVAHAQERLLALFRDLLREVAETGGLREDVAPDELASYCLHALPAAGSLPSEEAARRLVTVTLAGLRSPG